MRISDCGSDLCSSDLEIFPLAFGGDGRMPWLAFVLPLLVLGLAHGGVGEVVRHVRTALDRKSVVGGKSVSVRVDLGARSFMTKKNKKPRHTLYYASIGHHFIQESQRPFKAREN